MHHSPADHPGSQARSSRIPTDIRKKLVPCSPAGTGSRAQMAQYRDLYTIFPDSSRIAIPR